MKNILSKRFYSIEKKRELKRMIIIEKELKKINSKHKITLQKNKEHKPIFIKTPNITELEIFLEKTADKYDSGIKKSRKLHDNLIFLGLSDSGLKEYEKETKKQRQKRINKINKTHSELIKTLEENKTLEKNIKIIHKKLNEKIDILRK